MWLYHHCIGLITLNLEKGCIYNDLLIPFRTRAVPVLQLHGHYRSLCKESQWREAAEAVIMVSQFHIKSHVYLFLHLLQLLRCEGRGAQLEVAVECYR